MRSLLPASISFRALLGTVAAVGALAFLMWRQSLPPFVVTPFTICSAATEAAFPDETPCVSETDAAMNKMMSGMVIEPTGDVDRDFVSTMTVVARGRADKPGPIVQVQLN